MSDCAYTGCHHFFFTEILANEKNKKLREGVLGFDFTKTKEAWEASFAAELEARWDTNGEAFAYQKLRLKDLGRGRTVPGWHFVLDRYYKTHNGCAVCDCPIRVRPKSECAWCIATKTTLSDPNNYDRKKTTAEQRERWIAERVKHIAWISSVWKEWAKDSAYAKAKLAATKRRWARMNSSTGKLRTADATPSWVSKADLMQFYTDAARATETTGVKHHVDHIIPLKNKLVCGLHVPANLRVIPATENLLKSNKFEGAW